MSQLIGFPGKGNNSQQPPSIQVPLLGQREPVVYVVNFEKMEADLEVSADGKEVMKQILKLLRLVAPIFPIPQNEVEAWEAGEINQMCRKLTEEEMADLKARAMARQRGM